MFPDVDDALRFVFIPGKVVVFRPPGEKREITEMIDFVRETGGIDGMATAYVCNLRTFKPPTTDPDDLMKPLG